MKIPNLLTVKEVIEYKNQAVAQNAEVPAEQLADAEWSVIPILNYFESSYSFFIG